MDDEDESTIPATEAEQERQLVGLLAPYCNAREDEKVARDRKEAIGRLLKDFLVREDGILYDGEKRITARLQQRHQADSYDLHMLRKAEPKLFERLFELGCLTIDNKAAAAQAHKLGFDLKGWALPGKTVTALVVEEEGAKWR